MAQRIVTLCDAHAVHDEEVAGATWAVTLTGPGGKPVTWEVDLCEDDAKGLADLATMLGTVGRLVAGPKRSYVARQSAASSGGIQAPSAAEGLPCPVEGCEYRGRTKAARDSHVRHHHGTTYSEASGAPLPFACPGCERRFPNRQGLAAHHRKAHGGRLPVRAEAS